MKRVAVISILLNAALLVVWMRMGNPGPDQGQPDRSAQRAITKTVVTTNYVDVPTTNDVASPKFDWLLVESEDFGEYMANLRRLDCPEWLVKEIVLVELMRYYDSRRTSLERARSEPYRMTYREQRQAHRDRVAEELDLMQEEHDVMRRLTGSFRNEDGMHLYRETGVIALMFAGLSYDQGLDLFSDIMFQHDRNEAYVDVRNGYLTRADQGQLDRWYGEMKTATGSQVSAVLFEEVWLRLQAIIGVIDGGLHLPGIQMTGAQLRQLIRVRSDIIDPIRTEFTKGERPQDGVLDRLNLQVQEQLRLELGERIAAEYARSQNPDFQTIHDFATARQLPPQTAIDVFEVQQTAINEANRMMSNPDFDNARKRELRRLIQVETEKTLQSRLGFSVFETYRQTHGQWLDDFGRRDPFELLELPSLEVPQ